MELKIKNYDLDPKPKKAKDDGGIKPRDIALAFGQMESGQAVFIPGKRQQTLAVAGYMVAASRGGSCRIKKGTEDGVDGYYYIFMAVTKENTDG